MKDLKKFVCEKNLLFNLWEVFPLDINYWMIFPSTLKYYVKKNGRTPLTIRNIEKMKVAHCIIYKDVNCELWYLCGDNLLYYYRVTRKYGSIPKIMVSTISRDHYFFGIYLWVFSAPPYIKVLKKISHLYVLSEESIRITSWNIDPSNSFDS